MKKPTYLSNNTILLVILIFTSIVLSGCAGKHMFPNQDDIKTVVKDTDGDTILKVAFDQDGYIYPINKNIEPKAYKYTGFNTSYQLINNIDNYDEQANKKQHQLFAEKLNNVLTSEKTLIILIHGYNNSYNEANASFKLLRNKINNFINENNIAIAPVYLELHWDGLYQPYAFMQPLSYWFDAVTNSMLVGKYGLRNILNNINVHYTKPVYILTHSRGAAVATSTFQKPPFLPCKIKEPNLSIPSVPNITVKLAMLAPAIHPKEVNAVKNIKKIVFGVNKNDKIIKKYNQRLSGLFNSTTLGRGETVYDETKNILIKNAIEVETSYFDQKQHGVDYYINNDNNTFDNYLYKLFN